MAFEIAHSFVIQTCGSEDLQIRKVISVECVVCDEIWPGSIIEDDTQTFPYYFSCPGCSCSAFSRVTEEGVIVCLNTNTQNKVEIEVDEDERAFFHSVQHGLLVYCPKLKCARILRGKACTGCGSKRLTYTHGGIYRCSKDTSEDKAAKYDHDAFCLAHM